MTGRANAERLRVARVCRMVRSLALHARAALLIFGLAPMLFSPAAMAQGRRGGGRGQHYSRPAGRYRNQYRGQFQARQQGRYAGRQQRWQERGQAGARERGSGLGTSQPRGNYGGPQAAPRPNYPGAGSVRPALPAGRTYPYGTFPRGHLGYWLNHHRDVPFQGQEQLLRSDPSFRRLPENDRQRLMRQLQQVDRMPPEQRERRLERAEMIEHMSPQERMQLSQSSRALRQLPAGRQAMVKRAFQQLSAVPPDQRQTELNSARYQGMFSPQERNILGNLLRAEPYEPPH